MDPYSSLQTWSVVGSVDRDSVFSSYPPVIEGGGGGEQVDIDTLNQNQNRYGREEVKKLVCLKNCVTPVI